MFEGSYNLENVIENYKAYLNFLEEKLEKFFDSQKEFIFCKKGCGECCKNAQFPFSQIEISYLMQGVMNLGKEVIEKVNINIENLIEQKKNYKGEDFVYDCPFLVDNTCVVYDHRGIICRSFGLLTNYENEKKIKIPFCCFHGLNYSNVIDLESRKISKEKYKKGGFKGEPCGFNISYKYLTDPDFEETFKIKFGSKKALIDWFMEAETSSELKEDEKTVESNMEV